MPRQRRASVFSAPIACLSSRRRRGGGAHGHQDHGSDRKQPAQAPSAVFLSRPHLSSNRSRPRGSGGSHARHGPRIVMRMIPRRASRRLPTRGRVRRGTAGGAGGGARRRAGPRMSARDADAVGAAEEIGPAPVSLACRPSSSKRLLSTGARNRKSGINKSSRSRMSWSRVICTLYFLAPVGPSSPPRAMASRMVVSAWTFFIR